MPVRTQTRTTANARVSRVLLVPSSSFTTKFSLSSLFLSYLLLLSIFLAHPTVVVDARDFTPAIRLNEELPIITTLFESPTMNATACYRFYYSSPQILNASTHPNWMFATAKISAYEYGNRGVCGRCLRVRSMDNQFSVVVKVAGDCPGCLPDQIELSPMAFYGLFGLGVGAWYKGEGKGAGEGAVMPGQGNEGKKVKAVMTMFSFVTCPSDAVNEFTWPWIPDRQV